MAKKEEKPETKEPDETKDTTTKATPGDTVIIEPLVEEEPPVEKELEIEQPEKLVKEPMKPETKSAMGALVVVSISLLCLYFIGFNDSEFTISASIIISLGIIAGPLIGIKVGHKDKSTFSGLVISMCISGCSALATFGFMIGSESNIFLVIGLLGAIVSGTIFIVNWDNAKNRGFYGPAALLACVFTLPLIIGIVPISKYHNLNQIERNKKIVEILEITVLEDYVEVRLPSEHASDNSYLEKLLFVNYSWGMVKEKAWKDIVIPCREGDKYWYKIKLPFPGKKTNAADLFLVFKHAWYDYETTKEVLLQP